MKKLKNMINRHFCQTGSSIALSCYIGLFLFFLTTPLSASPLAQITPAATLSHGLMIQISYGLAACATLGLAFMAFGKEFRWRWLIAIVGGLAIIAASSQIVVFGTDPDLEVNQQALFTNADELTYKTANSAKFIAYGVAAIGVIGLGTLAILGRWKWPWAWGIVGGLLIIVAFPDISALLDNTYETGDVIVRDQSGRDPFADAATLAFKSSSSFKYIVYSGGALGCMGLAAMAFVGRFQWRWFFMIISGLGLAAGAYELIEYMGVTA